MNPENSPFINIELVRKEIGNLRPIEAYCNGFEKGRNQTLEDVEKIVDDKFLSVAIPNHSDAGDYWIIKKKDWNWILKEIKNLKNNSHESVTLPSSTASCPNVSNDRQEKDNSDFKSDEKSQPAVCDICGKTKEEHNHQQVLKKKGINKGKLLREYFWCSENKSDFRQYKERGEG